MTLQHFFTIYAYTFFIYLSSEVIFSFPFIANRFFELEPLIFAHESLWPNSHGENHEFMLKPWVLNFKLFVVLHREFSQIRKRTRGFHFVWVNHWKFQMKRKEIMGFHFIHLMLSPIFVDFIFIGNYIPWFYFYIMYEYDRKCFYILYYCFKKVLILSY